MLLGDTNVQQIFWSSGTYSLSSPSYAMFSESFIQEYFVDVSSGTGLDHSAF